MKALKRGTAFARRHKWRLIHGHIAVAAAGLLIAFLLGAFATGTVIYGTHLNGAGVTLYHAIAGKKVEHGQRTGTETLPAVQAAKVAKLNDRVANGFGRPHPLATPQPAMLNESVVNYSSRHGAKPILLVAHDTESPNAPGVADVQAIRAWFNNPSSQASSNYTTDADGNTIMMVPDTAKAWTQAWFNPWSISDEMIGHASQTVWPDTQLRAVAQIFAREAKRWGIPIQLGSVSGCTIIRAGIVDHAMLGQCGGGHHDNGPDFPLARFIALVKAYAAPAVAPSAKPVAKPVAKPTAAVVLRARTGFWSWLAWRLGAQAWKPYGKTNPTVRPHVPAAVPAVWWRFAAAHVKASKP